MKLVTFCVVVLLLGSAWINYQQKQKLDELRGSLANSTEEIQKLRTALEQAKKVAVSQPGASVHAQTQPQRPANTGGWMYENHANPLGGSSLGTSHK